MGFFQITLRWISRLSLSDPKVFSLIPFNLGWNRASGTMGTHKQWQFPTELYGFPVFSIKFRELVLDCSILQLDEALESPGSPKWLTADFHNNTEKQFPFETSGKFFFVHSSRWSPDLDLLCSIPNISDHHPIWQCLIVLLQSSLIILDGTYLVIKLQLSCALKLSSLIQPHRWWLGCKLGARPGFKRLVLMAMLHSGLSAYPS